MYAQADVIVDSRDEALEVTTGRVLDALRAYAAASTTAEAGA
jgi:hypothetical protein